MTIFGWARRRLGLQLLAAMVFVSIAPLVGAGVLLFRETESSLQSQVERHHAQIGQASAHLVRDYIRDAGINLEQFAILLAANDYDAPEPTHRELDRQRALAGIFLSLDYYQVASHRKNYYANSQQGQFTGVQQMRYGENGLDPKSNPRILESRFILEAKGGRKYVSSDFVEVRGVPFLVLSVPVLQGKEVLAVLAAHLDLSPVSRMLQHIAERSRLIELRVSGRTAASWGVAPTPPHIESIRPVGHADWQILVRETNATHEIVRRARRDSLLWMVAAAALALGLSALLSARILRPVRALTKTAEDLGRGDLAARSGIEREDELGILASQFDRMARSLQELDRLKSDFVAHVSHELRTPLTSAKLSLANLQDEVIGPMEPKQKEVVARIRRDMDRLIHMVNELLDLARLEAGKVELARESLDLADVVRQAAETARPLAAEKGVALSVETSALPATGDRKKLVQVILNLLDNAVKFTPSGGSVRVAISGREIAVEDTGPGLPDDPAKIFEKFAPRSHPGVPGAGLGLSIARKLVELHGGTIRAENRTGGGARFVIAF